MFESYFTKNLKEDEEVIRIVRIFPLAFIQHWLVSLFFLLLSFFLMFILFRQGGWGIVVFIILLLFGLIYGLRYWIIWSLNGFVITNKRIIDFDQRGFFDKSVSECTWDKIQDVSYELKGPTQTMFNFGSVKIQTAGSNPTIEIHGVLRPHRLQELITDTQRKYLDGDFNEEEEMSAADLLSAVRKIRAEIGEEAFNKIINRKEPKPPEP
ncbi:MAG: PH domain-containing protein [Patescibacteria group bacterium]